MKSYLYVSETDGSMYDTRIEVWYKKQPLRKEYKRIFTTIKNVSQLKATLRYGGYTWPGGYPMFFVTSDGAALHFDCVKENFRSVVDSIKNKIDDGWRVVGCDINYEDNDLICDQCGKKIESAYGEEEEEK